MGFKVQNQQDEYICGVDEEGNLVYTSDESKAFVFNQKLLLRWQADKKHKVVQLTPSQPLRLAV